MFIQEADNDLDALFEEEDDNMMLDLMAEEDKQQVLYIFYLKIDDFCEMNVNDTTVYGGA